MLKSYWDEYVSKVSSSDYEPKSHFHFDSKFDFKLNHEEVWKVISGPDSKNRLKGHSFFPFIKTIAKTPRYKYYEDIKDYRLATKKRPILLTAHFDKYIYGFYAFLINRLYQNKIHSLGLEFVPLAYRDDLGGKCNIQFSKEVFDFIKSLDSCSVILTDISSYFDNIDHDRLKDNWKYILGVDSLPSDHWKIFKALTDYKYVGLNSFLKSFNINLKIDIAYSSNLFSILKSKRIGDKTSEIFGELKKRDLIVSNIIDSSVGYKRGIPQGLSISAVLSNIYLIDFDQEINDFVESKGGIYRRYCDDIVVVIPDDNCIDSIKKLHQEIVTNRKLKMKASKTEISKFQRSANNKLSCQTYSCPNFPIGNIDDDDLLKTNTGYLQYLGFTYNGKNVLVRNSSLSRYYSRMSKRVKKTINMAYGHNRNEKEPKIFKKKLYKRYTHLGKRNFVSYVYNAASKEYSNSKGEIKEGHDSPAMKRQLRRHIKIIKKMIKNKSDQRLELKLKKGISVKYMK